jgi:hypothetical protein
MSWFPVRTCRVLVLTCIAMVALAMPAAASAATDLQVAALGNPPTTRMARQSFAATATITNPGTTRSAASVTSISLSPNRTVGADRLLRTAATAIVPGRGKLALRVTVTIPAATPAGLYYLVACADAGRRNRESNETNNCRVSLGRVRVTKPTVDITAPAAGTSVGATTAITFTSSSASASTCAIDGGTAAPCSSGASLALTSGSHTVVVRVTDAAGNAASDSVTFTADATAPTVGFTDLPADVTNLATDQFAFSANEAATFECRVDSTTLAPCTSPFTATGLSEGTHTFRLRATDAYGNAGSVLAISWTVDLTPPDTNVSGAPASPTNSTVASPAFTSPDGTSFRCSLDGATAATCTSPASLTGLTEGNHTFSVVAVDAAGNVDPTPATATWTVDTTAPILNITSKPSNPTNSTTGSFAFTVTDGSVQCQLDGGLFGACTSATTATYSGLAQGSHTFTVRSNDAANNVGSTSYTWTVDLTAPVITIVSRPPNPSNSRNASFAFTVTDGTVQCRLDGAVFGACSSATTASYASLSDGSHNFNVQSTDAAGNVGTASWMWTIDATGPVVIFDSTPANGSPNPATFVFHANESATFICSLNGAGYTSCGSGISVSPPSGVPANFCVKGTDTLGNLGNPTCWGWTPA